MTAQSPRVLAIGLALSLWARGLLCLVNIMRKAVSVTSVAAVLMLLMDVSVQAQQAVVPGRSIGPIFLGMKRADVWKHIGKPMTMGTFTISGRLYRWDGWRNPNNSHQMEVISQRGLIVQIARDVTDEERRGDVFLSICGQHRHLRESLYDLREEVGSVLLIDDARQGIAWTLFIHDKDGFGTHLLNEIGPDRIIAHQSGRAVLPDAAETLDEQDPLIGAIRAWFGTKAPQKHKGN